MAHVPVILAVGVTLAKTTKNLKTVLSRYNKQNLEDDFGNISKYYLSTHNLLSLFFYFIVWL